MPTSNPLRHLDEELTDLEERGLLRRPPSPINPTETPTGTAPVVLCSNDYLGYAQRHWAAAELTETPAGAGASRLVVGEHPHHARAEAAIADWLGAETALLFTSGYAANVGALSALARPGDVIVSDALNHASMIDGCRLSGAQVVVVPHLDADAVEAALKKSRDARRRWVATESYFSMDGDTPDLGRLRALCDAHDGALYVDEAHAIGVFGPQGRGLCAEAGVVPDVLVGTLGKALGLQGAFVVGSRSLRLYLWNRARSFVFSTGLSPAMAAMAVVNVRRAETDDAGRTHLHAICLQLREGLRAAGFKAPGPLGGDTNRSFAGGLADSHAANQPSRRALPAEPRGPIIPCVIGEAADAVAVSNRLRALGVIVQAIRPPTVPNGTARLRVTATAALRSDDVERALAAFTKAR